MDHFFNLGSYRRGLVLAFASLVAFSTSFGQSDLAYLTSLVRSIDEHTEDISSDIVTLYYDQNEIKRYLIKVEGETFDIRSILSNLVFDSASQLRVTDTGVLYRVSSIDSKMDRLEQAINNLTNYMCYSAEYTSTFNSNIAYLATTFFGGGWPPYSINRQIPFMEEFVEEGDYGDLWGDYGIWRAFPAMLFSIINSDAIPSEYYTNLRIVYSTIFRKSSASYDGHKIYYDSISKPISYQYGTRQLTDSFLQYTNQILFALNQINDSLTNHLDPRFISSSTSESGTSYGFSDAAANVARGISESASHVFSIEDDITQVETNPIVAISDSGYQSRMNQATGSDPSDGLGQIADDLNGYLQEHETSLESILQDNSSDYTFYFEVPTFSTGLRSNTSRVAYVVPNTNSSTRPYLAFICGVIKFALSLYFAYYVWDKIVLDLWKF